MNQHTDLSTRVRFDPTTGASPGREPIRRHLSDMRSMWGDQDAAAALTESDPLIYEYYDMGVPPLSSEVAYGTSTTWPGKVGDEYFMTKGHFHSVLEAAEVYYCLSGRGLMLMESPEGDWEAQELVPGHAVHVPGRYAHRSINTSLGEPLVTFFAFPANAGHDYGTIEQRGFAKLAVERDGRPELIDNPARLG